MSVKFDTQGCLNLLTQRLMAAVEILLREYLQSAQSHMQTREGAESLHEGAGELLAGYIAATIIGGAWAAMDNYGRGSLMDTANPALQQYRGSDLWNPARPDLAIRGRPKGAYKNIFGETRQSMGVLEGVNLETGGMPARFQETFAPWPPSHALETAAKWLLTEKRPQKVLKDALADFPWFQFIIATVD